MATTNAPCGCTTCVDCSDTLERTRFYQRQLVNADDLTQDQRYFREKARRHNRLIHGWGVVCGARCRQEGDCSITIESGYVLGPQGDEIVIPANVTVNLCTEDLDGNSVNGCGDPLDPWCADVSVTRRAGQTLYVAVRYSECQSRPVRGAPCGCGCDDGDCEYSRIRDSYIIKALTKLPSTYPAKLVAPDFKHVFEPLKGGRDCPPCPTEPWVILADVTMGQDGKISKVDCFAHRRYVVSFAGYFLLGS
jgi:hypothetical protein